MDYIRKGNQRHKVDIGWLKSRHSFSFGNYYDAKHMGVSVLRVLNDDTVIPGAGFAAHSHQDMEIISYVTEGELEHKDSRGNRSIIKAGEMQRMSAGSGITHSEYNASASAEVKFLQIWILPKINGVTPSFQQKIISQAGPLTPLVTPEGADGTLSINQDVCISRLRLLAGESLVLKTRDRVGYLHIVAGKLFADDHVFDEGDAFSIHQNQSVELEAQEDFEALWFDLPLAN